MKYSLVWADKKVLKAFQSLPAGARERLKEAVGKLSVEPRPPGAKMLSGKLKGAWRIRCGDFRVIYDVDDKGGKVALFDVGHRKQIYR